MISRQSELLVGFPNHIGTDSRILNEKSCKNCTIPTVCDKTVANAIYLASVYQADTVGCFLLYQETGVPNTFMMNQV